MPRNQNVAQWLPWVWYDSRTLGASAVEVTDLFSNPNRSTEPVPYYTNMPSTGTLPQADLFKCDAIAFAPQPDITAPLLAALMKGFLEVRASGREQYQVPLKMVPAGAGIGAGLSNQALATGGADYPANGTPFAGNYHKFVPAVELGGGEQFSIYLRWPVAPTALFFHVLLFGLRKRTGA